MTIHADPTTVDLAAPRSLRKARRLAARAVVAPRCLTKDQAAVYLGVGVDTVERAVQAGVLPVVRLPVETDRKTKKGTPGRLAWVLIDVRDLDALIERSKERTDPQWRNAR